MNQICSCFDFFLCVLYKSKAIHKILRDNKREPNKKLFCNFNSRKTSTDTKIVSAK